MLIFILERMNYYEKKITRIFCRSINRHHNCRHDSINTTTLYDVATGGISIVVDGQKINPTDVNGNTVEPMIYNGTAYLPVRAVANSGYCAAYIADAGFYQ